jgi:hypothetical protein
MIKIDILYHSEENITGKCETFSYFGFGFLDNFCTVHESKTLEAEFHKYIEMFSANFPVIYESSKKTVFCKYVKSYP